MKRDVVVVIPLGSPLKLNNRDENLKPIGGMSGVEPNQSPLIAAVASRPLENLFLFFPTPQKN